MSANREALEALAAFGAWVLNELRESLSDLDGGSVQDKAEELGLLVRATVTEPCGENCRCTEWDDFPQECLRYSDAVRAALQEDKRPAGWHGGMDPRGDVL